ncbi:MAG: HAD family hydrolase [Streptomycetaceae bacterium]|nr:HAD family hydrolase [Streptomycetaceae bacterium]
MGSRVVSFDLWGTLITYGDREAEAAWRIREFGMILPQFGYQVPEEILREAVLGVRRRTLEHQRSTGRQAPVREQVAAMLAQLGVNDEEALDVLVVAHTHAVLRADPQPYPYAREAVNAAKKMGHTLVLTSNTLATPASVTRTLLDYLDIEAPFDAMFFSSELGFAKPRPEVFAAVTEQLGVRPDEVVHIGNEWHSDVQGALAAGWKAVWFNPTEKPACPGAPAITSLADVEATVRALTRAEAAEDLPA